MTARPCLWLFLALQLVLCGTARADESGSCHPSFREVSDARIVSTYAVWRVYLMVALVGCRNDLKAITEEERLLLVEELREPTEWHNLMLVRYSNSRDLRAQVSARMNDLLGREVVTDVVFHDTAFIGHNQW